MRQCAVPGAPAAGLCSAPLFYAQVVRHVERVHHDRHIDDRGVAPDVNVLKGAG